MKHVAELVANLRTGLAHQRFLEANNITCQSIRRQKIAGEIDFKSTRMNERHKNVVLFIFNRFFFSFFIIKEIFFSFFNSDLLTIMQVIQHFLFLHNQFRNCFYLQQDYTFAAFYYLVSKKDKYHPDMQITPY